MVDQVVLAGLNVIRSGKVHTVLLADILDLLVCSGQTDNVGVELLQVLAQDLRSVSGWVTGDEDRTHNILSISRLADLVDDSCHLVEFIGANIGAVGEAEVDLS